MAGRFVRKPYDQAIRKAPQRETELKEIPSEFCAALAAFLSDRTTADDFHDMLLCCYDVWSEDDISSGVEAVDRIRSMKKERSRKLHRLYNPYRNISMNQSLGESTVPISEWMNLSEWREWD